VCLTRTCCGVRARFRLPEYNPYDLRVVTRAAATPGHHFVATASGFAQMLGGHCQELEPFHAWQRGRDLFRLLRKLVFFKHSYLCQVTEGALLGRARPQGGLRSYA
jgi:hypothetical protein